MIVIWGIVIAGNHRRRLQRRHRDSPEQVVDAREP